MQANDAEINNTQAQAIALNVNSSTTGRVGYYYNNKRDTADWYKITTKEAGLLSLSLTPVNGSYTFISLYDNDGITLLKSSYASGPFSVNLDGLAAGTYYVKVFCYYNYHFTPYVLSNNLVKPILANDAEPNNSPAQALALKVNSTTTGHVGYYYNIKRDTADWYKVTTTQDGMLKLYLTPANGSYVFAYLFDNNGTTQLNSAYSTGAFSFNTDGLAAGTYYVRINCYYDYQFSDYTLTDSLFTYAFANDIEPNKYPYQGKNISPNTSVTGHVNFYYNLLRNSEDWWKLNYTGSGDLQFVLNLAPDIVKGIPFTFFQVYKDTLAGPVYSNYFNGASNTINLNSLTKANYYIKIFTYYSTEFVTYSFSNSFTASAPFMSKGLSSETIEEKLKDPDDNITIYPNPVSNRLHIQVTGKQPNLTSITLRDANGKKVWSKSNLAKLAGGGSLDVNVKNYPGGIYFLQMTDVNGKNTIKKIIIIK